MIATDEFRAMLDERGVRWDYGPSGASSTAFLVNGKELSFSNWRDGLICSTIFTPAQAIAATLGADEYAIKHNVDGSYKCPKCGCVVEYDIRGDDERIITMDDYVIPFNFCPKCGAEVVDE